MLPNVVPRIVPQAERYIGRRRAYYQINQVIGKSRASYISLLISISGLLDDLWVISLVRYTYAPTGT